MAADRPGPRPRRRSGTRWWTTSADPASGRPAPSRSRSMARLSPRPGSQRDAGPRQPSRTSHGPAPEGQGSESAAWGWRLLCRSWPAPRWSAAAPPGPRSCRSRCRASTSFRPAEPDRLARRRAPGRGRPAAGPAVVVATNGRPRSTGRRPCWPTSTRSRRCPRRSPRPSRTPPTRLTMVQQLADVIILASLPIAGCSLAASVVAGLTERKRPFSLLRLTGTPLGRCAGWSRWRPRYRCCCGGAVDRGRVRRGRAVPAGPAGLHAAAAGAGSTASWWRVWPRRSASSRPRCRC